VLRPLTYSGVHASFVFIELGGFCSYVINSIGSYSHDYSLDTKTARAYALFMAIQHTVGELRDVLESLRSEIERLELGLHLDLSKQGLATRKLIGEVKIQEGVLLAKLAELESKQ
jgi:hypothetical protein